MGRGHAIKVLRSISGQLGEAGTSLRRVLNPADRDELRLILTAQEGLCHMRALLETAALLIEARPAPGPPCERCKGEGWIFDSPSPPITDPGRECPSCEGSGLALPAE